MTQKSHHRTVRQWLPWLASLAAVVVATWLARDLLIAAVGEFVVTESPLQPVDVLVVSNASPAGAALEAARLFHADMANVIVLPRSPVGAVDEEIQRLGVPFLEETELARQVLEKSGVPDGVIEILPDVTDGTGPEIEAIARFARQRLPRSILFITARSHTTRAAWLLKRRLPENTRVFVRSPRTDRFDPAGWWHTRGNSRELAIEYLRWLNALVGDPWRASDTE